MVIGRGGPIDSTIWQFWLGLGGEKNNTIVLHGAWSTGIHVVCVWVVG